MEELKSPTIVQMLRINTLHVKPSTLEVLGEEAVFNEDCFASERSFPYLKVCPISNYEFVIEIDRKDFEACNRDEIPEDLRNLIEMALENGCTLMFLEDEGDVCSSLPKFYD